MPHELRSGLLWALCIDDQGRGRPLNWSKVTKWSAAQGLLWLHMDRGQEAVKEWIQANVSERVGLHPGIDDALLAEETRPRCELLGGKLVLVLRGINHNSGAEPEDMVSLRLFLDGTRVISLRYDRVHAPRELREALLNGEGPANSGSFLVRLIELILDRTGALIEELADCLDDIEESVLVGSDRNVRRRLADLRRRIVAARRHLAPQREALVRLSTLSIDWIPHEQMADLRQLADRLTRYVEDLDEVRDRAVVTQDELHGRTQEQVNRRIFVLSLVAAIFLPLSLVTGLLGINVGGIPFADSPYGFVIILGILLTLAMLELTILRKLHWS